MLRSDKSKMRELTLLLPAWLKYSKNNLSVIFDRKGKIIDGNDLFICTFRSGDPESISGYFSEEEIIEIWNRINSFPIHNNQPATFLSQTKDNSIHQWEMSPYDDDCIIGIAQKQNISVNNQYTEVNIHHLVDGFMNNTPASAWICDEAGRVITMNKYYLSFGGLTTSDIGKTIWELFPKQLADDYFANNKKVIETGTVLITEEISPDKAGDDRHFLVYKFPLKTVDGNNLVGGWAVDITHHKAAEQKISAHNDKIKELAFLQSHEVRRPLANMLGLIELMQEDINDISNEKLKSTLDYLRSSASELDEELKKVIEKLRE